MKRKEKILIGVLLILLVIVIVIARNKNKKVENNTETQTPSKSTSTAQDTSRTTTESGEKLEDYVEVLSDGTKLNRSESLTKDKTFKTFSFKNIQLTNGNGQSQLLADVTNTGSEKTDWQYVNIVVLDKDGNEVGKVAGVIMPLNPGQSTQFNSSTQIDYINAYDFKVEEGQE